MPPVDRFTDDFARALDDAVCSAPDETTRVRAVRAVVLRALADEQLVLDLIERVMATMQRGVAWVPPVLYQNERLDYAVRMIYWPPRYANHPHQHNSWTVTGVVCNELEVSLYQLDPVGQPVTDRDIHCCVGEVGYIASPCIHSIANPTDRPSASLHVFSDVYGADHPDAGRSRATVWYPSDRCGDIATNAMQRALAVHVALLDGIRGERATSLLDVACGLARRKVALDAIKVLWNRDRQMAASRLGSLAEESPDDAQLQRLAIRIHGLVRRSGS